MGVSEDQRPEGEDVVDVAVPVDVEEVCTLPALDEDGGAADGTEGVAHHRVVGHALDAQSPANELLVVDM